MPQIMNTLPPDLQVIELGRQVMRAKRCTACHEMKVNGEDEFWKPQPALHARVAGG
jgi:cytochrome c2